MLWGCARPSVELVQLFRCLLKAVMLMVSKCPRLSVYSYELECQTFKKKRQSKCPKLRQKRIQAGTGREGLTRAATFHHHHSKSSSKLARGHRFKLGQYQLVNFLDKATHSLHHIACTYEAGNDRSELPVRSLDLWQVHYVVAVDDGRLNGAKKKEKR